jgi:hypothetical protein
MRAALESGGRCVFESRMLPKLTKYTQWHSVVGLVPGLRRP